ncbi:hypothetical protein AAG906_025815 [Vitis piasezkii]
MDLDGNQFSELTNMDQLKRYYELYVIVLSIITFIDDVTSLHVGFERIFTPLRVLFFTIILVFAFDSSISFHSLYFSYSDPFPNHPKAMGSDVIFGNPYLDICTDSRIIISVGYMLDLLYIPIKSFSSHQDRPDALVAILGHIFPFSAVEMIVFSEAYYILAFRAIIASQLRRLEPSTFSVSAFRVIIASQFRRSEPSSLLSFGVQSHHRFSALAFKAIIDSQFRCLEPPSLFSFGSHHHFSILAFRDIIASRWLELSSLLACYLGPSSFSQIEPSLLLNFGVQSHHRFSISVFRATIASHFWRLEPSSLFSLGIQSHHPFLVPAFKAIIAS